MTLQIVVFALLAGLAALVVAMPLLRRPRESAIRAEYDLRVYKDQLGEIDRDLERGLLTPEQADSARLEIQRRMLAADAEARAAAEGAHPPGRHTRVAVAALVGIVVPLGALALYGVLGSPALPDRPFAARQAESLGITTAQLDALRDEISALEARLKTTPDDQKGWIDLGQRHQTVGDYGLALGAYDEALKLGPVPGEVWASIGEANVMAENGQVSPRAEAAFVNALKTDRQEPRSRYYMGLAAYQGEDPARAIAIWRDLSQDSPPDAPWLPMLRGRIAQVAQQAGLMPTAIPPQHPLDPGKVAAGDGSDAGAQMRAESDAARKPGEGFSSDEQDMIGGMIDRLKDRLAENPNDADGWMRLGRSLSVLKDFAGSADAYAKAVALRPDAADARFGLAMALLQKAGPGNAPEPAFFDAVAWIRDNAGTSTDALYLGGIAAQLQGRQEEAKDLWTQLLDRLPEDSPARAAIQHQLDAIGAGG